MKLFSVLLLLCFCAELHAQYCEGYVSSSSLGYDLHPMWRRYVVTQSVPPYETSNVQIGQAIFLYDYRKDDLHVGITCGGYCGTPSGFCDKSNPFFSFIIMNDTRRLPMAMISIGPGNCNYTSSTMFTIPTACQPVMADCSATSFFQTQASYNDTLMQSTPATTWTTKTKGYWGDLGGDILFTIQNFSNIGFTEKPDLLRTPFTFSYMLVNGMDRTSPDLVSLDVTLPSWKLQDQCLSRPDPQSMTVLKVIVEGYEEDAMKSSVVTMMGLKCPDQIIVLSTQLIATNLTSVEFFVAANVIEEGGLYQGVVNSLGTNGTREDCISDTPQIQKDIISFDAPYGMNSCFPPFSPSDYPPDTTCSYYISDGSNAVYLKNTEHHWKTCVFNLDLAKFCGFRDNTGLFTNWSVQGMLSGSYYLEPLIMSPMLASLHCDGQLVIDASASYSDLPATFQWEVDTCYPPSTFCNEAGNIADVTNSPVLRIPYNQSDFDSLEGTDTNVRFRVLMANADNSEGLVEYSNYMTLANDPYVVEVRPQIPPRFAMSPSGTRVVVNPIPACDNNDTISNVWQYLSSTGSYFPGSINYGPEVAVSPMKVPDNGTDSIGSEAWFAFRQYSYLEGSALKERYSNTQDFNMTITPKVISYYPLGSQFTAPGLMYDMLSGVMLSSLVQIYYPPLANDFYNEFSHTCYNEYYSTYSTCYTTPCYPCRSDVCTSLVSTVYYTSKDEQVPMIQFKVLTLPAFGKMLPDQSLSIQALVSTFDEFLARNTTTQLTDITFTWESVWLQLNDSRVTDTVTGSSLVLKPYYWKYLTRLYGPTDNTLKVDLSVQATLNGVPLTKTTSTFTLTDFVPTLPPSKGRILVKPIGNKYELRMADWTDDDVYNYNSGYERPIPRLLRYQFKYFQTTNGKPSAEVNLSPLQYGSVLLTKLPSGNITVVGYAYDVWGASGRTVSPPFVIGLQPIGQDAVDALQEDVDRAIANGNPDAAVTALTQLLMTLNSDPDFDDIEYRLRALQSMKDIGNITFSYDMYAQLLALFPHITAAIDKLDPSLIHDTLKTISDLLNYPFGDDGINAEEAKALLAAFSDALEFKQQKDDLNPDSQFNISSSIWRTEGDVISKLFQKLECGSPSSVVEAPNINVYLKKGAAAGTFPSVPLSEGAAQSSFVFPDNTIDNPCVGVHYVSYISNIFDFSSQDPAGEIIGLDLFDEDGQPINTHNLTNPVIINIAMNTENLDLDKETPACTFWNPATKGWDNEGCEAKGIIDISPTEIILVCECSHLTNYTAVAQPKKSNNYTLLIIIVAAVGGSIVILLAAILVVHIARRKGKEETNLPSVETPAKPALVTIPPDEVVIEEKIGGGAFGEVYKGTYLGTTAVALKRLTAETNAEEFEEEAALLQNLRHTNIVYFLGIYTSASKEKYMVTEFMPKGSVLGMLKKLGHKLSVLELINLCKDAAAGMSYLEMCKIVHRDLAARNLLISGTSGNYTVKVADFGMSRKVEGMTAQNAPEKFPVKWTAPEAIESKEYSSKADVWSFGVTMWEIFELGASPYSNMTNKEAASFVIGGNRLTKPEKCPDAVYKLMMKCWASKPEDRPNFKQIYSELQKIASSLEETSSDDSELEKPQRKVTAHKVDYQTQDYASPDTKETQNNDNYEQPPVKSKDSSSGVYHSSSNMKDQSSGSTSNRYSAALGRDEVEMKEVQKKKKPKEHEYEYDRS